MPNIREYSAPSGKINPDEKGYAAFETAGRRIGPLYNQAAQDVEKGGKLQDQLLSQLERETDAAAVPEVLRGNNSGRSRGGGGGGGGGSRGGGGGGGYRPQSSGSDNFVDPLDAANAAKWAASTARKLTGSPGNGGSLDELEWQLNHDGLTRDQQQRYQMLSDIQAKKDNTAMDVATQNALNKYIAARDATTTEWYGNLAKQQNIGPNSATDPGAREFDLEMKLASSNPNLATDAAKSFDVITGRSSAAGEALSAGWNNVSNTAASIGSNVANGVALSAGDLSTQSANDLAAASEGREDIQ